MDSMQIFEDDILMEKRVFDTKKIADNIKYKYNLFNHDVQVVDNGDKTVTLTIDGESETDKKTLFNVFSNVSSIIGQYGYFGNFKFKIDREGAEKRRKELGTTLSLFKSKDEIINRIREKFDIEDKIDYQVDGNTVKLSIGDEVLVGTKHQFQMFYSQSSGNLSRFGGKSFGRIKKNSILYVNIRKYKKQLLEKFPFLDDKEIDITYNVDTNDITLTVDGLKYQGSIGDFKEFVNKEKSKKSFGGLKLIKLYNKYYKGDVDNDENVKNYKHSKEDIDFNKNYIQKLYDFSNIYQKNENGYTLPLIEKDLNGCTDEKINEIIDELGTELNLKDIGRIKKERFEKYIKSLNELDEAVGILNERKNDWTEKEVQVATKINGVLREINKHTDIQKFYSCQVGGSDASDVIVVKDIPKDGKYNDGSEEFDGLDDEQVKVPSKEHNKDYHKHKDTLRNSDLFNEKDEFFFVEVKLDYKTASYLKFSLNVDISGDEPKIIYDKRSEVLSQDNILGNQLTKIWKNKRRKDVYDGFSKFGNNVKRLVEIINDIPVLKDKLNIKKIDMLPQGFEQIATAFNFMMLEYISDYAIICSQLIYNKFNGISDKDVQTKKNKIEKYLSGLIGQHISYDSILNVLQKNRNKKFKRIYNLLINGSVMEEESEKYDFDVIRRSEIKDTFLFSIDDAHYDDLLIQIQKYYYNEKKAKYLQIGQQTFLFKENDDPLELGCPSFDKVFINNKNLKYKINITCDLDRIKLQIFLNEPSNVGQDYIENMSYEKIKDSKFIKDTNVEYRKTKAKSKEDETEINESILEGTKTSDTATDKFEIEVADGIRRFLDSQNDEKYRNLGIEHYEGSDRKYWSDIKITNPNNDKNIWVEAKLNKYSNLGGPSFKYSDGEWTCTTTDDENPLTQFYLDALKEHSQKFISFCKDYLKKDDIKLPTDLSEELVDAWKRSGSVDDTDNDVQFITDKIVIEDFGRKVAEYYQSVKIEPVYYMQVADSLYIIDSNYNPLNLITRKGDELKPISDAHRIGRIQFRMKGLNKSISSGDKKYYSINMDVKILADKENDDNEYSCSFLDEEKWPVIRGENTVNGDDDEELTERINDVLNESCDVTNESEELKMLTNVSEDVIKNILDNEKMENDRYNRAQFTKYFGINEMNWCVLMSNEHNLAIAALIDDNPYDGCTFINEIQTLKKGYGRKLLEMIVDKYKSVWLTADTTADEKLLNFYRKTRMFKEYTLPNSSYGVPLHVFYTNDVKEDKLREFVDDTYGDDIRECIERIFEEEEENVNEDVVDDIISDMKNVKSTNDENPDTKVIKGHGELTIVAALDGRITLVDVEGYTMPRDSGGEMFFDDPMDAEKWALERGYTVDKSIESEGLTEEIEEYDVKLPNDEIRIGLIIKEGGKNNMFLQKILNGEKRVETRKAKQWNKIKKILQGQDGKDIIGQTIALMSDKKTIVALADIVDVIEYKDKDDFIASKDGENAHWVDADDGKYGWNQPKVGIKINVIRKFEPPKTIEYMGKYDNQNDILNGYLSDRVKLNSEAEQDIGGEKSDVADQIQGTKIWIDDIREVPEGFKWIKTVREFIRYIDEHGTDGIELIDTDHDAGDYQNYGGDYIRCFDYLDFIGAKDITIHIHSANPVGANNIRRIISKNKENGWKEVRNTDE